MHLPHRPFSRTYCVPGGTITGTENRCTGLKPDHVETQPPAGWTEKRQALGSLPGPRQRYVRHRSPFPSPLWRWWSRDLRWSGPRSAPKFNFLLQLDPVCNLQGFFMNCPESYSMPSPQILNTFYLKEQGLPLQNRFQNTTWSKPAGDGPNPKKNP